MWELFCARSVSLNFGSMAIALLCLALNPAQQTPRWWPSWVEPWVRFGKYPGFTTTATNTVHWRVSIGDCNKSGWMDGWMRTSVHGSDPSLEIIHWPPIPPRTLHRCDALGRVIPANNQSHSCKYSTGVNLTVLGCWWCNYNCQLRKAPPTTVFNLYNKPSLGKEPKNLRK